MKTPQLYRASIDYADALRDSLDAAKRYILLETMVLDQNGEMSAILAACLRACERGVCVVVIYDIYAHRELVVRHGLQANHRFRQFLNELERAGATIHRVGASKINPFAGRHHAKAVIVDDCTYIGGGVNLTGDSFKTLDFMLRFDDAALARMLFKRLLHVALERRGDQIMYSDSTTEVLLDAGVKGESLIYNQVCALAGRATGAWYVSKLAPDAQLVRLLQQTSTQYWYNSLSSASVFDKIAILIDQIKVKVPNNYKGKALLHAKFCVFELPDGHYEAISGSHNFNSRGVAFGTQELAVHTKDQLLCKQLIAFANNLSVK